MRPPATRWLLSQLDGGLHDRGLSEPLLQAIAQTLASSPNDIVLDAGCGDGFYLGSLARQIGFDAHGVDISTRAIEVAARRYPECEWIVANADRSMPYADKSFSTVLSITARMNPGEFRRLLRDDGRLLVALPAPEDLSRAARWVAPTLKRFEHVFKLVDQRHIAIAANAIAEGHSDGGNIQSGSLTVSSRLAFSRAPLSLRY
jgi:SAM-dependent methyltransferase